MMQGYGGSGAMRCGDITHTLMPFRDLSTARPSTYHFLKVFKNNNEGFTGDR